MSNKQATRVRLLPLHLFPPTYVLRSFERQCKFFAHLIGETDPDRMRVLVLIATQSDFTGEDGVINACVRTDNMVMMVNYSVPGFNLASAGEAEHLLELFAEKWDSRYPSIAKSW